jgi:hypothetical protein
MVFIPGAAERQCDNPDLHDTFAAVVQRSVRPGRRLE